MTQLTLFEKTPKYAMARTDGFRVIPYKPFWTREELDAAWKDYRKINGASAVERGSWDNFDFPAYAVNGEYLMFGSEIPSIDRRPTH